MDDRGCGHQPIDDGQRTGRAEAAPLLADLGCDGENPISVLVAEDRQPGVVHGGLSRIAPQPSGGVVLLRIAPEIFSVLDYSKGFGHSDLITFSERDLDLHIESLQHRWDGNGPTESPSTASASTSEKSRQ